MMSYFIPKIILYSYFLTFMYSLQAQEDSIYTHYYPFKNYYVDMNKLQKVMLKPNEYINLHYKNKGEYADYFQTLTVDRLIYQGYFYDIADNNGLNIVDVDKKIPQTVFNEDISAERYGQHFLIAADSGVILVKHLGYEDGFKIYKYAPPAKQVYKLNIIHTQKVETATSVYYRPFLTYISHNHKQLMFSSYDNYIKKTYLVDLETGKLLEYNFIVKNVLYHKYTKKVKAFIHVQKDSLLINFIDTTDKNISYQNNNLLLYNSVEVCEYDDKITLVCYDRTKSGYWVLTFDKNSKKILHEKKYINTTVNKNHYQKIWLSNYNNYIMIEGLEPTGRYLHVFEQNSFKKVLEYK